MTARSTVPRIRLRLELQRPRLIAGVVLAATVIVMLLAFWPGRVNVDTLGELKEVDTAQFTNRAAPLLFALWHPLWTLGVGPGLALAAQTVTFVAGAYLILRAAFRPAGAAAAAALIALWPPILGNLASLQRDTWFAALLLLTFGIAVRATQRPWPTQGRYLALAVLAAWLALACRQNAAAAVTVACVVIAALLIARWRQRSSGTEGPPRARPWSHALGAVLGGVALTLALVGTQVIAKSLIGVRNVHPETPLYIYDLAAISERQHQNYFPAELMPQRGMAPVDRTYDVDSMLVFLFPKPHTIGPQFARRVGFPNVRDPAVASLRHAWLDAVTDHPGSYLAARWTLWLRQIGITRNGLSVYPPDMPNNGGYTFAFPRIYNGAMTYLEAFTHPEASFYGQAGGDFLFTVWCYLLPALLSAIVFLRRGTAAPLRVVGALGVSALTYQAGLFVAALGTRFRFEFPCVAIGMVGAAVLLGFAWTRWRASFAAGSSGSRNAAV